jgi:pre-rRNA-processing protein TSR4
MSNIDLGFAQQIDTEWKLKNKYFPSKIGGKPVFLDLKNIPQTEDLKCGKCGQRLRFLLQIYAPIETQMDAFHRTLFVFCCHNNHCNQFKVLRSQLPRINPFYSSDPPNYDLDEESYDPKPEHFGHQLCIVCGFVANNKCSKCLKVNYCSKDHQIIDWKEGKHKQICGKTDDFSKLNSINFSVIFPEYELIIGDNESDNSDCDLENDDNNDSDLERNEIKKYNDLIRKSCPKYQNQNFEEYEESDSEEQKVFDRFKRLSSGQQVIRYCSYNEEVVAEQEPLWISAKNRPQLPIPNCQYCGGKRRFEFQIMPQLLNKIQKSESSLDWGLLIVYTCANSCSTHSDVAYKQEFIWKQNIP